MIQKITRRILLSSLLYLVLGFSTLALAQQNRLFDRAMTLYQQEEFDEAAGIFLNQTDNPEALLYGGKSLFAAGHYLQSINVLTPLGDRSDLEKSIIWESKFTSSLAYIQLNQFGAALHLLHQVKREASNQNIGLRASNTYQELLHYLTLSQRLNIYQSATNQRIRRDLIQTALDHVDSAKARPLIDAYNSSVYTNNLNQPIDTLAVHPDSIMLPERPLRVPNGLIHDIGVPLPAFDEGTAEFNVTQSLYFGILLAAEQFNRRNNDQKVFLQYHQTNDESVPLEALATDWIWNNGIDLMLGPLFSESAHILADLAEEYHIPLIAPLANSDSLNIDNPYVFQANPTFAVRGREMAQYAVRELKLDTLAIIVESNSLGATAAYEFRNEAERLGAYVPYFFTDDFSENGYDLSEYRNYFINDQELRDSLQITEFNGVYAPFTGRAAPTMVDLFLTDLEAGKSEVTILGSQEWTSANLSAKRLEQFDIYYPSTFALDDSAETVQQFKMDYQSRFNIAPTQFSYIGYNTADFVFKALESSGNPALLKETLKHRPRYSGLGADIAFEGTHRNHALKIFKMLPPQEE
jgi:ABC-type branched-subunit amino acid transport system substrate-binding protein